MKTKIESRRGVGGGTPLAHALTVARGSSLARALTVVGVIGFSLIGCASTNSRLTQVEMNEIALATRIFRLEAVIFPPPGPLSKPNERPITSDEQRMIDTLTADAINKITDRIEKLEGGSK